MHTKMQVISSLWIFQSNKINRTDGHKPLEELKYYWEFKRLAPKCLCLFDVYIPYICVYTFRCFFVVTMTIAYKSKSVKLFRFMEKKSSIYLPSDSLRVDQLTP